MAISSCGIFVAHLTVFRPRDSGLSSRGSGRLVATGRAPDDSGAVDFLEPSDSLAFLYDIRRSRPRRRTRPPSSSILPAGRSVVTMATSATCRSGWLRRCLILERRCPPFAYTDDQGAGRRRGLRDAGPREGFGRYLTSAAKKAASPRAMNDQRKTETSQTWIDSPRCDRCGFRPGNHRHHDARSTQIPHAGDREHRRSPGKMSSIADESHSPPGRGLIS